jgi:hypothetical protein
MNIINYFKDPNYVFLLTTIIWMNVFVILIRIYDSIIRAYINDSNHNLNTIKYLKKELRYYKKFQYLPRRRSERLRLQK